MNGLRRRAVRWVLSALIVAAIFGGLMRTAAGAIAIGGAYGANGSGVSSLSWSATLASGSDRLLTVRVVNINSAITVTSVTWGGTPLTLLGTTTSGTGASHVRATIYYLVAPAGTTNTVVVNLSGSTRVVAGTLDFTGVSQITPFGPVATASGSNNAPSFTVSAATGDVVSDVLTSSGSAVSGFSAGGGQTMVYDFTGTTSSDALGAASTKAGSASTSISYSHTSSSNWALIGMAVKPVGPNISGTVYEDRNYSGGAGRSLAGSSGAGVTGATVELYNSSGTWLASTTTAAGGTYSFVGPAASNSYYVRAVSGSVKSTRTGGGGTEAGVLTYRTTASSGSAVAVTDHVGGFAPALVDAGSAASGAAFNTGTFVYSAGLSGTAQAVAPVALAASNITGVDFGFNFDTVTSTRDTGAGSLRQAITNANALGGDASLAQTGRTAARENLVFMISNGTTGSGGSLSLTGGLRTTNNYFSGGVATISPASALPSISTVMLINAQAQQGWVAAPIIEIDGTSAGSSVSGLDVYAGSSTVRGLVINRFNGNGIQLLNLGSNTVAGNYFGTNAAGSAASANGGIGINIFNSPNNTVGGTVTSAGNVVSGNTNNGIVVTGTSTGNLFQGNFVGTNATGTARVQNGTQGVYLNSATNTFGGTTAAARNVISGNTFQNILIDTSASGTIVQGNVIGPNAAGTATLASGYHGVEVASSNNQIGGTAAGAGNVIAYNGGLGVLITGAVTGNRVLRNSLYANSSIGIDLANNLVTVNDGAKTSGQPNQLMDSPVFTSATVSGSTLTVAGYVGSAAGQSVFTTSRVEVFVSDNDASGYGEGQSYIGFLTANTSGNFSGSLTIPGGVTVTAGITRLTGTATDTSNNTSEFGANYTVPAIYSVSGTVFEDLNYGGGAGRSLAASSGAGVTGARVELYNSGGTYVSATTTAAGGSYSFTGLSGSTTYHVRVVSSTVPSTRSGSTGSLVGVLTYRAAATAGTAAGVADFVGGTNPALVDPGNGGAGTAFSTSTGVFSAGLSGTAQAFSQATTAAANLTGIDFGFNFDTVSNTNDSGQGSLRQAITNANTLGGDASLAQSGRTAAVENLVFMLPNGTAAAGLRSSLTAFSGGVASIAPASALPAIGTPMVLDAQTQPGWTANPLIELNGTSAGTTSGLVLSAAGSAVRGFIVNRFAQSGLQLSAAGQTVQGCWIGLNAAGTAAAANTIWGVYVSGGGSNTLGGTTATARNVLSGNGDHGLYVASGNANVIQGNYFGTNAAGTAAVGNVNAGLYLHASTGSNTVGGSTAGQGNVFSGNATGIVSRGGTGNNTIRGNLIGRNAANTAALPNTGVGIFLDNSTNNNRIGGTGAGDGNVISGNGGIGVRVSGAASTGNAIQGNSVYANGGLGIDLGTAAGAADGVTANDGVKTTGQPSLWMDSPVFTTASVVGSTLNVAGYVGSAASQSTFASSRVEVFVSDNDASGFGEGQSYIGALTADASGNFSGTLAVPGGVTVTGGSTRLTGTATDTSNNTSEFGANVTVAALRISGTVFEDLNYGGGAGRTLAASSGVGVSGATVELYSATGTLASTTTTASDGRYSFAPAAAGGYLVRVVQSTVRSSRSGSTAALLPVQTYRYEASWLTPAAVTNEVGGARPDTADSPAAVTLAWTNCAAENATCTFTGTRVIRYGTGSNWVTRVATSSVSCNNGTFGDSSPGLGKTCEVLTPNLHSASSAYQTTSSSSAGVDFGFNFNTVVNANDAGQGSLRQAITNANALGGDTSLAQSGRTAATEHLVFMISNGTTGSGGSLSLTGGLRSTNNYFTTSAGAYNVATITLASGLTAVTSPLAIDAQAQPGWTLEPRIEINGNALQVSGFVLSGGSSTLRGFVVNRLNNDGGSTNSVLRIDTVGSNVVQGNWFGPDASGATATTAQRVCQQVSLYSSNNQFGGATASARNVVSNASCNGIVVGSGDANAIQGNYIGTNAAGSAALANGDRGILLLGTATNTRIGGSNAGEGNVVSGNAGSASGMAAISVGSSSATGTLIQGNLIGLNAAGTAALANGRDGIYVAGGSTTIGGTTATARNVIGGNAANGVSIVDGGGQLLQGNTIGLNAAGTAAVANGGRGVSLTNTSGTTTVGGTAAGAGNVVAGHNDYALWLGGGTATVQGNYIGTNAAGSAAIANAHGIFATTGGHQIGGTTAAARNVVSGNTSRGIWLDSAGNTVQGNYVGTNAAGTAALANADGIYVKGASNVVGGSAAGAGNLISGNSSNGVLMNAVGSGSTVQGNVIGLNAAGTAALGNTGIGVNVQCSSACAIGGTASGAGNTIANSSGVGVSVSAGSGHAVLGNSIYANGSIGIDLGANGITANDGAKTSGQPNLLMDAPVLTTARARGNQLTVAGYIGTAAGQSVFAGSRVEVFISDTTSSSGSGRTYLGALTADASGNFSGAVTMPVTALRAGSVLTGTATDTSNNTSEFGANFSGLAVDWLINDNGDGVDANPGDGLCETSTPGQCTLRAAIMETNAWAGADLAAFNLPSCPGAGCIINPASALPAITEQLTIDGQTQPGWKLAPLVELRGKGAGNGTSGLWVAADRSIVRGLSVGGFMESGISIKADGVTVEGNYVGVEPDGVTANANGVANSSSGGIYVLGGTGIVIGGAKETQRNVLSGNRGSGVLIDSGTATIIGNYIGTDATGAAALGNDSWGVTLAGGKGHRLGGSVAGEGNVISGNVNSNGGVLVLAGTGHTLQGNTIGLNAARLKAIPNGSGDKFSSGVDVRGGTDHLIGGLKAEEGNVISGNQGFGIRVASQTTRILGNSIYDNLWLGIDLGGDGVTANDGTQSGALPNNDMDHPVITSAGYDPATRALTLTGYVGVGAGQAIFANARIELFTSDNDPTGYGEGRDFVGTLTADANGRFSGTVSVPVAVAYDVGTALTGTATDTSNNTSEFGPNYVTTTMSALAPSRFNAFETSTAVGALTGVIQTRVAGVAGSLAVIAINNTGTGLQTAFAGTVTLEWMNATNNSGALDAGNCRASWVAAGSAGSTTFVSGDQGRRNTTITPAAVGREWRLRLSYAGPGGTVTSCATDPFAVRPDSLAITAVSDTTDTTAGTVRALDNLAASGGRVHHAGRPFSLRAAARDAASAVTAGYDGTPVIAITGCVLPAGCTAGTLSAPALVASSGLVSADTLSYSEVGAINLQLTDDSFANIDAADTLLAQRRIQSAAVGVGRFVPDRYLLAAGTSPQFATQQGACAAAGQGFTYVGQSFGWATTPSFTVTAQNAAGGTTTMWAGALQKLSTAHIARSLAAANAQGLAPVVSWGSMTLADTGAGTASVALSGDQVLFSRSAATPVASFNPLITLGIALSDTSEVAVSGNSAIASTAALVIGSGTGIAFNQGSNFHYGRLKLQNAFGDARRGVRANVELQKYTSRGWLRLSEDNTCLTLPVASIAFSAGSGAFATDVCAAPATAAVALRQGRGTLVLPRTAGNVQGAAMVTLNIGPTLEGNACAAGVPVTPTSAAWPHLLGARGSGTTQDQNPAARLVWGRQHRDYMVMRELF